MNIPLHLRDHGILRVAHYTEDVNGNITGLVKANGDPLVVTDVVADWAELQAIPKTAGNDNIVLHVDGLGVAGSDWRYKHDYSRWFAVGEPILALGYTPVNHSTGASLTTVEAAIDYQLPNDYGGQNKSILQDGDFLIVASLMTKSGTANAMTVADKLHTASGTGGTQLATFSPASTNIHVGLELTYQRTSATKLRLVNQVHSGIGGNNIASATTWQGDITVSNLDTSAGIWLHRLFSLGGTSDTSFRMEDFHIRMRAGRAG